MGSLKNQMFFRLVTVSRRSIRGENTISLRLGYGVYLLYLLFGVLTSQVLEYGGSLSSYTNITHADLYDYLMLWLGS